MIDLLRTFLAVVDSGGVTPAAAALNMSQAAASQQVKRLEDLLACRLFERVGRKLVLAPAGERLLAQAQRLVAQSDELLSTMRAPAFAGEVRLGVPYDIIGSFVPAILRRFARAQPRVRVSLVCEDSKVVRQQLRSGGVDLALTTETECGRHGETLRTDRLVWVGMPGGDAHLKDPLPVSLGAPTCVFRPVAIEALGKVRRDWRAVCEVSRSSRCMPRSRPGSPWRRCCAPRCRSASRSWAATRACRRCRNSASTSTCRRAPGPRRAISPIMSGRVSSRPAVTIDTKPNCQVTPETIMVIARGSEALACGCWSVGCSSSASWASSISA